MHTGYLGTLGTHLGRDRYGVCLKTMSACSSFFNLPSIHHIHTACLATLPILRNRRIHPTGRAEKVEAVRADRAVHSAGDWVTLGYDVGRSVGHLPVLPRSTIEWIVAGVDVVGDQVNAERGRGVVCTMHMVGAPVNIAIK